MARMKEFYVNDVAPALMKKFGYKSVMQIPKLETRSSSTSAAAKPATTRR